MNINNINLLLIASSLLAILFAYIPGFATWYEPLEPTRKRLIMAGLLLVVTAGTFGYSCVRPGFVDFTCSADAAWDLATNFVLAIMANQTVYDLLGKFGKTKEVEVRVVSSPVAGETATVEVSKDGGE